MTTQILSKHVIHSLAYLPLGLLGEVTFSRLILKHWSFLALPMSLVALAAYSVKNHIKVPTLKRILHPSKLLFKMCSTHAGISSGKIGAQRQVLPSSVVPKHYRVFLNPDLTKFVYSGNVEIDLEVRDATDEVSLNILDLVIKSTKLNDEAITSSEENKDAQTITWKLPKTLQPKQTATLSIEFDGELNDKLCGFYRSVHKDSDGNQQVVATTQMEATDCRRAFPCFDEPALKASFDISIAADPKYTVLSNSSVKSVEERSDGKQLTRFETTPLMSTYLVAFVVGELSYVESKNFRVPVRVYATPGMEGRCQYAADLAAKTLAFFENQFGIEYPMPKCDMVGIHDFSAGAMENWGLITYRLVDVFYTEGKDPASAKTRVTEVVLHELAHQWFGNLVTMEWWDGLWLNEGFATWMSWFACNHFYPGWKVWETYVNDTYQGCLQLDGLRSSHPVQVSVNRADEVAQIFDAISYLKGSCVIRMVSQFLGEDVFLKGIAHYLSRHKYGNTTTDDLWAALSEASGKDVKKFMDVWTKDVGYPILTAKDQIEGSSSVEVTQNRFLATGDVKPNEDETIYPIYLGVRKSDGSVDHSQVLDQRTGKVEVGSADQFYKLNADQNGIFRVKYPDSTLAKLAAEGSRGANSKLSVEDRIGLLSDLRALCGSHVPVTQLLTVAEQWKSDSEPNVLTAILDSLAFVASKIRFESKDIRDEFKAFRRQIVVPLADKLGTSFVAGEDMRLTALRTQAIRAAIAVEDQKYIDFALSTFAEHKFDSEPNLQAGVYAAVAKYGKPEQWDELLNHYLEGTNGTSGVSALRALGSSESEDRKNELLKKILESQIRSQDSFAALAGIASSSIKGTEISWNWLTSNWSKLRELFPVSGSMIGYIVKIPVQMFTQKGQLDRVDAFFADKDLSGIDRALEQSKDSVRASISFLESDLQNVKRFLDSRK